jgi:hypothetical protein
MFGIGRAIKEMHDGKHVCRTGWNGKGQFLALQVPDANNKMTLPYVYITTVNGFLVPWICSQTDLLAVDWELTTATARTETAVERELVAA